ncbi:MAG: aminotransferase class I/II-fold pyridoxal phosphate-dependent enzyme [Planctomycetes bacterium]|jgi:histidinol-phosphate aminotransferase|nr:aminotransferase class I/II-fold pyridoxal phosphate-dependent enzyme [Planctomycetota bacterium]
MNTPTTYAPPAFAAPITLDLSRNEGRAPRGLELPDGLFAAAELARYPDVAPLREAFARRHGVAVDAVLVTAGADDALLRLCLLALRGGGEAVVPQPTFEMIDRYVAMVGGTLQAVPWPDGEFPIEAVLAAANERTAMVFVVSPNNPTGAVATVDDLRRLATALPQALVVLDAAYAEFADEDLCATARQFANVVVVRTLSKAWGLAGLRIGCAIGTPALMARLRAFGNPLPVAGVAARVALQRLATGDADLADHVAAVRRERCELAVELQCLGARPAAPAQGNFVLARGVDAPWLVAAAASLGIALRAFPDREQLRDAVRIGLPGDPVAFARLCAVLRAALAPEALLFDVDGVLVDVSRSYRQAIVATARGFGAGIDDGDVAAAKARGNANDDWAVTHALVAARGITVTRAEVIERFERHYQALRAAETALVTPALLQRWGRRCKLAAVTGRPRADAEHALARFGFAACFDAVVVREDAPLKPDPAPVRLALERLGVQSAWMLGDTVDDLAAARAAGVVPIGVIAPGPAPTAAFSTLHGAGAARVLACTQDLDQLLSLDP